MTKTRLTQKLDTIGQILPISKVIKRQTDDTSQIARYYHKNRLAYRLFNSHDGFVHMGISEGDTFSTTDFYTQAKLIDKSITSIKAKNVLELAPGKAATTYYLANKYPKSQFYGIDLPNGQFKTKSKTANISFTYGDYHDLSEYKDSSMDVVYVIEALCHATDKAKVVKEVYRVLRKDGLFIVIDGYFTGKLEQCNKDEQTAVKLVASSMMVTNKQQTYSDLTDILIKSGFQISDHKVYSKNIMPSLYRLEATAARFMKRPKLAKLITLVAGDIVTANAAAGYLMPECVTAGLFEYRYTLTKK